jgi:hypothetical protein
MEKKKRKEKMEEHYQQNEEILGENKSLYDFFFLIQGNSYRSYLSFY